MAKTTAASNPAASAAGGPEGSPFEAGTAPVSDRDSDAGASARTISRGRARRNSRRVSAGLAAWLGKADKRAVENIREMTGVDISDHDPEDLRVIDAVLDASFRQTEESRNEIESASIVFGSYLGQVLVENLPAEWHYPGWFAALSILSSRNPSKGGRHFYVQVRDEKVDVFNAARAAIERTASGFSLWEFYQRCAGPTEASSGTPHGAGR